MLLYLMMVSVYHSAHLGMKTIISAITAFQAVLSGSNTDISYYNTSQDFSAGDLIHVFISYTGSNSNNSHDISVQLDMF